MSLTLLVTGATSGFGDAISRRAVPAGPPVIAPGPRAAGVQARRDGRGN